MQTLNDWITGKLAGACITYIHSSTLWINNLKRANIIATKSVQTPKEQRFKLALEGTQGIS